MILTVPQNRSWIQAHHHVVLERLPALHKGSSHFAEFNRRPAIVLRRLRDKLPPVFRGDTNSPLRTLQSRADGSATSDFARLARRLCGKSIGVVLGGGGARGISHVGALRALQEAGIPVDMIGGTSIGAFIGGLYARDADLVSTLGRAKRFSGRMSTLWRLLTGASTPLAFSAMFDVRTDVTWPIVAYTTGAHSHFPCEVGSEDIRTGHEFNRGIFKSFLDYQMCVRISSLG